MEEPKEDNNLDLKIFITSMLLLELMDETKGDSKFKFKLKYHLKGTITHLETLLSVPIKMESLSLLLTDAAGALEKIITRKLDDDTEDKKDLHIAVPVYFCDDDEDGNPVYDVEEMLSNFHDQLQDFQP
jgi:hypothetical protein